MNVLLKIGTRAQLPLTRGRAMIRDRRMPVLKAQTRWRIVARPGQATVA